VQLFHAEDDCEHSQHERKHDGNGNCGPGCEFHERGNLILTRELWLAKAILRDQRSTPAATFARRGLFRSVLSPPVRQLAPQGFPAPCRALADPLRPRLVWVPTTG